MRARHGVRPRGRQRAAAAAAARLSRDASDVARRGAGAGAAVHGRGRRPARLRRVASARRRPRTMRRTPSGRWRPTWWRRWRRWGSTASRSPATTAAAGSPTGWRWITAVVSALAVLDIVPTAEVWARADDRLAFGYWHWGFLAQPAPLPERLIGASLTRTLTPTCGAWGSARRWALPGGGAGGLSRAAARPGAVQRSARTTARGRRRSRRRRGRPRPADRMPGARAVGTTGALPMFYEDVLAVWRPWASDLRGRAVEASHFLVEDEPDEVAGELAAFFEGVERGASSGGASPTRSRAA